MRHPHPADEQVAFYGSTPAYWPVLEVHGLQELGRKLNVMSKAGQWDAMAREISDDVVRLFTATGTHRELARAVAERFGGAADTVALSPDESVALVLAGWTTFGMWCLWLGRLPSRGFRQNEDDDGDGGGGGGGPDDGRPDDRTGPRGGDVVDWDVFERDFAAYVQRSQEPDRGLEPAAD